MNIKQRPTPSTRERLLRESINELTPSNSLRAVEDNARHLLSSVSIAGTLVGGLGVVSASEFADVGFGWALPAVVCVAASVAVSAWVLIPMRATISPGRLDLMDQWYADQIKRRGRLMRIAGVLFAVSIPLALLPLAANVISGRDKTLDISVVRDGAKTHTNVRATHLPADASVAVTVKSVHPRRLVARGTTDAGDDGAATLVLDARTADALLIKATAVDTHGRSLAIRTLVEPEIK
jgi:hypothetical protein